MGTGSEEVFTQPGEWKDWRLLPRPSGNHGTPGLWSTRLPECQLAIRSGAPRALTGPRLLYQLQSQRHFSFADASLQYQKVDWMEPVEISYFPRSFERRLLLTRNILSHAHTSIQKPWPRFFVCVQLMFFFWFYYLCVYCKSFCDGTVCWNCSVNKGCLNLQLHKYINLQTVPAVIKVFLKVYKYFKAKCKFFFDLYVLHLQW